MGTVLIVDDEKAIRVTLSEFLARAGHAVVQAATAAEVHSALAAGDVDVAVVDILLGQDNGIAVATVLRQHSENMQIIMMTGESEVSSARMALHLHVFDYLAKPVSKEQILAVVDGAWKEKQRRDEYDQWQRQQARSRQVLEQAVEDQTAALLEMLKWLRHVPAAVGMGVWQHDLSSGCIGMCDEAFSLYGLEPRGDGLSFATVLECVHPDDRADYADALERMRARGFASFEHRIPQADGQMRRLRGVGVVERDASGNACRLFGTVRDAADTNSKWVEAEHRRLQSKLQQSQRMESIGTLASGVAHEINNPINGIMNYAQLIKDGPGSEDTVAEYAGEIIQETERVATIVRNLLAFARRDTQVRAPQSVSDILDGTLSLIRTVMRHDHIRIDIDVPSTLPEVSCLGQKIQQVLMNLLTNARDALNEKFADQLGVKTIRIAAELLSEEGREWVRISVRDNGPGVDEHVKRFMCDPFFTTKRPDRGTGLGLSISHGIVAEHGGRLMVESVLGEWTRVSVDLPVEASGEHVTPRT